jgi:sarcosine oxidase gamma subunit
MRDLTSSWPRVPDWTRAELDQNGITVRTVEVGPQHLVSGNLAGFTARAGLPDQDAGAFATVSGERYALRIARDRMLVVNGPAVAMDAGWHEDGYAVTDVSAMYHVFEIEGDGIAALLGEAMFIDPDLQSPSAATMFAGQGAIVYYRDRRLLVHIDRGFAPFLWQWLEARV